MKNKTNIILTLVTAFIVGLLSYADIKYVDELRRCEKILRQADLSVTSRRDSLQLKTIGKQLWRTIYNTAVIVRGVSREHDSAATRVVLVKTPASCMGCLINSLQYFLESQRSLEPAQRRFRVAVLLEMRRPELVETVIQSIPENAAILVDTTSSVRILTGNSNKLSVQQALTLALQDPTLKVVLKDSLISSQLIIYPKDTTYYLAWRLHIPLAKDIDDWNYVVDASNGTVLDKWNAAVNEVVAQQKKIEKLQPKLKDCDEAISCLIRENIERKKV